MDLKLATRSECYAFLESYQNRADHEDFPTEFGSFCRGVVAVLQDCGRSADMEGLSHEEDFLLPPEESYPDDRGLVLVTFKGGRLTGEILFELSRLVQEHEPKYHLFIDGSVSHGRSFEIVLEPDGQVLGHEREGTDLLSTLGFSAPATSCQAE